jgi:hypothetical protein
MYLDEIYNNFLGTLRPTPDLRENNPSLEHGKYINDRSKFYAGKSMLISTDNSIDGSGKNTEIKIQVPSPCLIERSSGPEFETVIEGFNIGSKVVEGNQNQCTATAGKRTELASAITRYNTLNDEYRTELSKYTNFRQNLTYSRYLEKYVKIITRAGTASQSEESTTYYINKYGFRYTLPKTGTSTVSSAPSDITPTYADGNVLVLAESDFSSFPVRSNESTTINTVQAGQNLNLAGKIVTFPETTSGGGSKKKYAWIDIEGVAHIFGDDILTDAGNNASATCQNMLTNAKGPDYTTRADFVTALGGSGSGLIGSDVTTNTYMCSEVPTIVNSKKEQLDAQEIIIKDILKSIYATLPSCAGPASTSTTTTFNQYIINENGAPRLNLPTETTDTEKKMPTYDGKVSDTFKNVKSKLAYYVLWLILMVGIIVVTFRTMANSEGPSSGSFQASAAILLILIIYLFNFLSSLRLGPQQTLNNFFGALPEKVSGMFKFTFT